MRKTTCAQGKAQKRPEDIRFIPQTDSQYRDSPQQS